MKEGNLCILIDEANKLFGSFEALKRLALAESCLEQQFINNGGKDKMNGKNGFYDMTEEEFKRKIQIFLLGNINEKRIMEIGTNRYRPINLTEYSLSFLSDRLRRYGSSPDQVVNEIIQGVKSAGDSCDEYQAAYNHLEELREQRVIRLAC